MKNNKDDEAFLNWLGTVEHDLNEGQEKNGLRDTREIDRHYALAQKLQKMKGGELKDYLKLYDQDMEVMIQKEISRKKD